MNHRFLLVFFGALLAPAGCARVYHHATFPENKPIAFGSDLGVGRQYAMVRPFSETDHQLYFFLHWFPIKDANGVEIAERYLHEGDGIANLRIRTYYGPIDLFFSVITVGLITPYTVEVHGDIVRLAEPPPRP